MSITQITEQEQRLTNTLRQTTEALTLVTAERDALRADAERYRWLRDRDLPWSHKTYPQSMVVTRWSSGHSPDEIDAAIDEAIRRES